MQPGIVAPNSFPIRDPKDKALKNGRVANSPRYMEMGGLSGPNKWPKDSEFKVDAPTRVSSSHSVAERSAD